MLLNSVKQRQNGLTAAKMVATEAKNGFTKNFISHDAVKGMAVRTDYIDK